MDSDMTMISMKKKGNKAFDTKKSMMAVSMMVLVSMTG
jgi:hypothetical protein